MPGFAGAAGVARLTGFTHAVASGEPAAASVLLWTRYVPADGGATKVRVEMAESADFAKVVSGGAQITDPWRDHTAKITVDGLKPGREHHFRVVARGGSFSPVGNDADAPGAAGWPDGSNERARFPRSAQAIGGNTVVVTGDSHNAWAFDLPQDGKLAAVEFAGHSVTSHGYEGGIDTDPKIVAAALVAGNPDPK